MKNQRNILPFSFILIMIFYLSCGSNLENQTKKLRFSISFSEELLDQALDGRLLLMISTNDKNEPRFQINDGPNAQQIFGIDVNGMKPGESVEIDQTVFGYPLKSISKINKSEYWVQGLINRYETFNRGDGHSVKLPMDQGEGQHWNRKPGNLYSSPKKISIDPAKNKVINIQLDKIIPPIPEPETTKYIKHVKIQSKLLTEFWGRPMFLGAHVLLPEGFDEHPEENILLWFFTAISPIHSADFGKIPPIRTWNRILAIGFSLKDITR